MIIATFKAELDAVGLAAALEHAYDVRSRIFHRSGWDVEVDRAANPARFEAARIFALGYLAAVEP